MFMYRGYQVWSMSYPSVKRQDRSCNKHRPAAETVNKLKLLSFLQYPTKCILTSSIKAACMKAFHSILSPEAYPAGEIIRPHRHHVWMMSREWVCCWCAVGVGYSVTLSKATWTILRHFLDMDEQNKIWMWFSWQTCMKRAQPSGKQKHCPNTGESNPFRRFMILFCGKQWPYTCKKNDRSSRGGSKC